MTKMLASGNQPAISAAVCLVREGFCRTGAQPGPLFAANRLAVANSNIATVLADMMQTATVEGAGLLTPAVLAETVAVLVAGQPSYVELGAATGHNFISGPHHIHDLILPSH